MILREIRNSAGFITLNRPEKANALNSEMANQIAQALTIFNRDDSVRCIVIKATGKTFCAGADLKELKSGNGKTKGINIYSKIVNSILNSNKPVIARLQGAVVGGGVGIVAACHLAVGEKNAYFLTPEVKSGLFPLMVFQLLEEKAGRKTIFEMTFCEKRLTAHEAWNVGLINCVVEYEKLDEKVDEWIEKIKRCQADVICKGLSSIRKINFESLTRRIDYSQKIIDEMSKR